MSDLHNRIASIIRDHHAEEFPEPVVTHDSVDDILAAVAEALTPEPSLEDVPAMIREINLSRISDDDGGGWYCQVGIDDDFWPEGDGATIDEAIRAAVAKVAGEQESRHDDTRDGRRWIAENISYFEPGDLDPVKDSTE